VSTGIETNIFLFFLGCDFFFLFQVCRTFNTLCDVKPDLIGPFINSVAAFMLAQTGRKEDSDLQCEACEFWQVLGEQVQRKEKETETEKMRKSRNCFFVVWLDLLILL
jgi:hypothetical protein